MMKKIVFFALYAVAGCVEMVPVASVPISAPQRVYDSARQFLAYDFKDPSSATFRAERAYKLANGEYGICGEVNGKNSFGAFVGFKPYYVRISANGQGKSKQIETMAEFGCNQLASGTINLAK